MFPFVREREALPPLWKFLTFTQNIGLDVQHHGTFSHAWSLCIEEQFYLLLPLILAALVYFKQIKKAFWLLIVLFFFGFAARFYSFKHIQLLNDGSGINWYKYIYYPTWCRLDGLLVGISIAALLQFKPTYGKKILSFGNLLFVPAILIFIINYIFCSEAESFNASVFGFLLVDTGYGFIVLAALSSKCFLHKHQSKITSKIAALSYGIYLIHKMIIHLTQIQFVQLKIDDNSNIMFLISIATVFIAALILNEIIEKPFLKLRKRFLLK